MVGPTFCGPHLDAFCLLDRLGLAVTGQLVAEDHPVLACKVVEPDHVADRSLLASHPPQREFRRVVIDFTPVRDGTGPSRLLDMVSGCSQAVFTTWLQAHLNVTTIHPLPKHPTACVSYPPS